MKADVVVIGAEPDGLVAARYLARAGRRVLVLERRAGSGGVGDGGADVGWVPPRIVRDLDLAAAGLRNGHPDPWVTVPLPEGGRLELSLDVGKSVEAIRRISPPDAARWPEFRARMRRLAAVLETLYVAPPPDPLSRNLGGLLRLAGLGLRARRLGRQGMEDLLRLPPMPVADLLDEWFENDALKGAIAAAGVMHHFLGPRSGGSAFLLLHHHVGCAPGVFRPPASNLSSLLARAPAGGPEVRRGAEVSRISVRAGRVTGMVLDNGEEIATPLVISNLDARRTLCELVEPGWLDPELVRALGGIKCRGVAARLTLALERPPSFKTFAVAPSPEYLERGFDAAKYGRVSGAPYLEASARSAAGKDGRHRVDVHVQWVPYALRDGEWDDARRRSLGALVVETLSRHAPEFKDAVVDGTVIVPTDLEAEYGRPGGHAYHGELSLDQILFMRPVPECARYRTPIRGLYLCGPGTHPGGPILGASGANAARQILTDDTD